MDILEFYENNKNFSEYIDSLRRVTYADLPVEELLKHKIVIEVAEYYGFKKSESEEK